MIGKTDWTRYLHTIRKREVGMVFGMLPETRFVSGLEIGAGDGYQTALLSSHINKLISSDLNFKRIKESLKVPGVEYRVIDADSIGGVFGDSSFDFIFSSNVLEHLRDPYDFLLKTQPMLTDNGYAVHIVPSRYIKIFYLVLYYPNLFFLVIDRIIGKFKGQAFFRGKNINFENNINLKTDPKRVDNRIKKFLIPSPHGNFPTHTKEFVAFGRNKWEELFRETGYSIVAHARGPAFSGYGFGLGLIMKIFEYCGISSEHIFVLKKMSLFEKTARAYTKNFLPHGSIYEKEKFVRDWMKKEKSAKAFIDDFISDVGNPRGKKILDVGFGNGIMLLEFAKVGAETYGLETESALLGLAERRFRDNHLKAELVIYDGRSFPFPDETFDYCYSTSVLEHMSYPGSVISEIARTLRPGGKFYLSFPNKYAPKESHTGLWFISWLPRSLTSRILRWTGSSPLEDWNLHFISYFTLRKMAKRTGLRIVHDTKSQSAIKSLVKKVLALAGVHFGVFLKTIIIVLEKPN